MKTLTVANQKGGTGKTTIVFHLATYMAMKNKSCAVIDLDQQGNATLAARESGNFLETVFSSGDMLENPPRRADTKIDRKDKRQILVPSSRSLVDVHQRKSVEDMAANFYDSLERLKKEYSPDFAIIDTSPMLGEKMSAALLVSDYVVSPVELGAYSLSGLDMMLDTIKTHQEANAELKFIGLIANKVAWNVQKDAFEDLRRKYKKITIPHPVSLRKNTGTDINPGYSVLSSKNSRDTAAQQELTALCGYILKQMEK